MSAGKDPNEPSPEFLFPYSHARKKIRSVQRDQLPRVPGARVEDSIPIADGERLLLVFESVRSDWHQGVHLETDRFVEVDGVRYKRGVVVFHDPKHTVFDLVANTKEGVLWVWNVWDFRPGETTRGPGSMISHANRCGMIVEPLPNGVRYRCNEGRDDDDFDDLIFRIERLTAPNGPPER